MPGGLILAAAAWHVATREVLLLAAAGIAVSTIDDCFVDAVYVGLRLRRRVRRRSTETTALPPGTGWMAIVVPAWDEAGVIGPMLRSMTARLDHPRYRVFVGTYPNDPATLAAIVAVGDARIVPVMCRDPGPTTKADCLNHLWRAVVAYEADTAIRFKAVVFHDAEDVVDRDELRVFDHLIPGLAMVQLPVIPLVDPGSRWVSGHYLDEFAESHGKDIIVRGAIGAAVPSAGVACAIDRDVFGELAGGDASPFDPACMTEDYELGMRIAALGHRSALVRIPGSGGAIATREHFPATFDSAVRQKTRWLLGIALSGWDRVGWRGGLAHRYMLMRDRKSIFAPLLAVFGYLAVAMVLADAAIVAANPGYRIAPLVADRSPLALVLWLNSFALGWRLGVRAAFTAATHGWREGCRALPRTVVGNWINAVAAVRALRRYARIRAGREAPAWDKTLHKFTVPAE